LFIVSDRDDIQVAKSWKSLFGNPGVFAVHEHVASHAFLPTSSAFHPTLGRKFEFAFWAGTNVVTLKEGS